jgi:urea carboxylase-associated protein 1
VTDAQPPSPHPTVQTSPLLPAQAVYRHVIPAGDPWTHEIKRGQILRIVDVEGNQAADTLFYDARDPANRYSASDTIRRQAALYLGVGTELISTDGDALLTIVADTCGRHDTIGGACSRESNTMRYAHEKEFMHACRDSFICGVHAWRAELGNRDITCNINFFMNVPVTPDGRLTFADGVSAPGYYVELRAERDVVCVLSNCPQLNNPCNAYNPTPIEVLIWEPTTSAMR